MSRIHKLLSKLESSSRIKSIKDIDFNDPLYIRYEELFSTLNKDSCLVGYVIHKNNLSYINSRSSWIFYHLTMDIRSNKIANDGLKVHLSSYSKSTIPFLKPGVFLSNNPIWIYKHQLPFNKPNQIRIYKSELKTSDFLLDGLTYDSELLTSNGHNPDYFYNYDLSSDKNLFSILSFKDIPASNLELVEVGTNEWAHILDKYGKDPLKYDNFGSTSPR